MKGKWIHWAGALIFAGASVLRAASSDEGFSQIREATFEAVWGQVDRSYYDGEFGGKDWGRIGERYRKRLARIRDMDALREHLKAMLFELGDSHLGILTASYGKSDTEAPWGGGWAGLELCYAGEALVVYRLDEGGAAFRSGIRLGDEILSVGGRKPRKLRQKIRRSGMPEHLVAFSTLHAVMSHFQGREGDELEVVVKPPGGKAHGLELTLDSYGGRVTEALGNIGPMPFAFESKELESGLAYLRFNLWFPAVMGDIRKTISELGEETPGLVIDLRGNPGGMGLMAGGLAGLLVERQTKLGTTTLREGHINFVGFPQRKVFSGPVAVLVDEASLSTSEIFAIGLQAAGRVRVFGQPTPGAALPSIITSLPNGDYLQVALGDFETPDGRSLETRGVVPDEIVAISPVELSRGGDTVMEAARRWILNSN